jgi:hypothetical protein
MPAANGRLIEGGYRIVNAANAVRRGQISWQIPWQIPRAACPKPPVWIENLTLRRYCGHLTGKGHP